MKEHLYTPSCTLNTGFSFSFEGREYTTPVSGDREHAMLLAGSRQFIKTYTDCYKAGQKNLATTNFLNASIGVLYSDAPLEEGDPGDLEFLSYPYRLMHRKKYIFDVKDVWNAEKNYTEQNVCSNKSLRNKDFNHRLDQHFVNASPEDIFHFYHTEITIKSESKKSQFHETFHHTEQGALYSLYSAQSMEMIFKILKSLKNMNTLGALFLDAHTPRPMCVHCNLSMVGFQNSQEQGFLSEFQDYIRQKHDDELGVNYPDGGMALRARISCLQHSSRDKKGIHRALDESLVNKKTPEKSMVTFSYQRPRQVVQAYVDQGHHDEIIREKKYDKKDWNDDIFVSHEIPEIKYNHLMRERKIK